LDTSEVRQRILDEHEELRGRLGEIEALLAHFEAGHEAAGAELRERGLALFARFAAHIDLEDRSLAPLLRAAGAAGEARADRLAREHREQRELLQYLMRRLASQPQPTALIAGELRNFAGYLRTDMAHEEETLLAESALAQAPPSNAEDPPPPSGARSEPLASAALERCGSATPRAARAASRWQAPPSNAADPPPPERRAQRAAGERSP
jgi:Hemerythrin HHE cation binding domain